MRFARKHMLGLLIPALCAASAHAGEYSKVSPGIQIEVGHATGGASVPFQNESGNIQGGRIDWVFGVGLTAPIRLGEVASWRLQSLMLVPTLGGRFGRTSDSKTDNNFIFYGPDGGLSSIQMATISRTTKTMEISLAVPLRWYPGGSAAYGGFYLEAGPIFVRAQEDVQLDVSGLVLAQPIQVSESTTLRQNDNGLVAGVGVTQVNRSYQFSYGLTFQSITSKNAIASNQVRLVLAWTF